MTEAESPGAMAALGAIEVDWLGGQIASENSPSPDSLQADPRLVFLARAGARELLVDAGELTIDEAFDGLVPAFVEILKGSA
jgi:hypothetical protein